MAEEDRPWEGPLGYADWLADLKERIRQARLRASLAVNRRGRYRVERQAIFHAVLV